MRCIIRVDWAEHFLECDCCEGTVCDDCAIFDDTEAGIYCSEDCQQDS